MQLRVHKRIPDPCLPRASVRAAGAAAAADDGRSGDGHAAHAAGYAGEDRAAAKCLDWGQDVLGSTSKPQTRAGDSCWNAHASHNLAPLKPGLRPCLPSQQMSAAAAAQQQAIMQQFAMQQQAQMAAAAQAQSGAQPPGA